jgi:hypothetical protein
MCVSILELNNIKSFHIIDKLEAKKDLLKIVLDFIEKERAVASWEQPTQNGFGETYCSVFERIIQRSNLLWNKRLPMMIQAYFEDIMLVLQNLRTMAHDSSVLWLVVSTSAYVGVEIPVDLIIADIGNMVGWEPQEVNLLRKLRSSGQHWNNYAGPEEEKPHLRESVIIFHAA